MEMGEHSPSWRKPVKLPIHNPLRTSAFTPRCKVGVWHRTVEMVIAQWRAGVKPTHVEPLDKSLGNPINSLSRP